MKNKPSYLSNCLVHGNKDALLHCHHPSVASGCTLGQGHKDIVTCQFSDASFPQVGSNVALQPKLFLKTKQNEEQWKITF